VATALHGPGNRKAEKQAHESMSQMRIVKSSLPDAKQFAPMEGSGVRHVTLDRWPLNIDVGDAVVVVVSRGSVVGCMMDGSIAVAVVVVGYRCANYM